MQRRTFVAACLAFCGLRTVLGASPHVKHPKPPPLRLSRFRVFLRRKHLRRWIVVIARSKADARYKARHACPGWRVKKVIRLGWW